MLHLMDMINEIAFLGQSFPGQMLAWPLAAILAFFHRRRWPLAVIAFLFYCPLIATVITAFWAFHVAPEGSYPLGFMEVQFMYLGNFYTYDPLFETWPFVARMIDNHWVTLILYLGGLVYVRFGHFLLGALPALRRAVTLATGPVAAWWRRPRQEKPATFSKAPRGHLPVQVAGPDGTTTTVWMKVPGQGIGGKLHIWGISIVAAATAFMTSITHTLTNMIPEPVRDLLGVAGPLMRAGRSFLHLFGW